MHHDAFGSTNHPTNCGVGVRASEPHERTTRPRCPAAMPLCNHRNENSRCWDPLAKGQCHRVQVSCLDSTARLPMHGANLSMAQRAAVWCSSRAAMQYPELDKLQYPSRAGLSESAHGKLLLENWRLCLLLQTLFPRFLGENPLRRRGVTTVPLLVRELLNQSGGILHTALGRKDGTFVAGFLRRALLDDVATLGQRESSGVRAAAQRERQGSRRATAQGALALPAAKRGSFAAAAARASVVARAAAEWMPARPTGGDACVVLMDRHVHKNGGFSFFEAMASSNGCRYFGHTFDKELALHARAFARHTGGVSCIEAHERVIDDWDAIAPPFFLPCRTVIVWRVRRPDLYYRSFYVWAEVRLNFTEWMPRNLQANIVLRSHNSHLAQHHSRDALPALANESNYARYPRSHRARYFTPDSDGAMCRRARRVAKLTTLLWPADTGADFARLLRAVAVTTGLEALANVHVRPQPPRWRRASFARFRPSLHPGINVTAMSLELAPCDWALHALALRRAREFVF